MTHYVLEVPRRVGDIRLIGPFTTFNEAVDYAEGRDGVIITSPKPIGRLILDVQSPE